jgi:hypothetical protein
MTYQGPENQSAQQRNVPLPRANSTMPRNVRHQRQATWAFAGVLLSTAALTTTEGLLGLAGRGANVVAAVRGTAAVLGFAALLWLHCGFRRQSSPRLTEVVVCASWLIQFACAAAATSVVAGLDPHMTALGPLQWWSATYFEIHSIFVLVSGLRFTMTCGVLSLQALCAGFTFLIWSTLNGSVPLPDWSVLSLLVVTVLSCSLVAFVLERAERLERAVKDQTAQERAIQEMVVADMLPPHVRSVIMPTSPVTGAPSPPRPPALASRRSFGGWGSVVLPPPRDSSASTAIPAAAADAAPPSATIQRALSVHRIAMPPRMPSLTHMASSCESSIKGSDDSSQFTPPPSLRLSHRGIAARPYASVLRVGGPAESTGCSYSSSAPEGEVPLGLVLESISAVVAGSAVLASRDESDLSGRSVESAASGVGAPPVALASAARVKGAALTPAEQHGRRSSAGKLPLHPRLLLHQRRASLDTPSAAPQLRSGLRTPIVFHTLETIPHSAAALPSAILSSASTLSVDSIVLSREPSKSVHAGAAKHLFSLRDSLSGPVAVAVMQSPPPAAPTTPLGCEAVGLHRLSRVAAVMTEELRPVDADVTAATFLPPAHGTAVKRSLSLSRDLGIGFDRKNTSSKQFSSLLTPERSGSQKHAGAVIPFSVVAHNIDCVTVLFVSITNLERVSLHCDPRALVESLNTLYSRLDDIVRSGGVYKVCALYGIGRNHTQWFWGVVML